MILISHRGGNLNGPNPSRENTNNYIHEALKAGYHVECDIRVKDGILYLGHDEPREKMDRNLLLKPKMIFHCKDEESVKIVSEYNAPKIKWFVQDEEPEVKLNGVDNVIWNHSKNNRISPIRILVVLGPIKDLINIYGELMMKPWGICSDSISDYKELIK